MSHKRYAIDYDQKNIMNDTINYRISIIKVRQGTWISESKRDLLRKKSKWGKQYDNKSTIKVMDLMKGSIGEGPKGETSPLTTLLITFFQETKERIKGEVRVR